MLYTKNNNKAKTYIEAPTDAILLNRPTSTYISPEYNAVRASPKFPNAKIIFTEEEKKEIAKNDTAIINQVNALSSVKLGNTICSIVLSLKRQKGTMKVPRQKRNINIGNQYALVLASIYPSISNVGIANAAATA